MFEQILAQMPDRIRTRRYVMTLHAEDEMEDDALSIFDVESSVLTGKIIERQKDVNSDEWKYLVRGQTLKGDALIVVGKLSLTGKLVMITVYRD
jgi:hypothetical protein